MSLDHAFVAEAKEPVMADHHVIKNAYAHDIADFFEPPGDIDVLWTGRRIAARMIMDEDNGGGGIANHRVINLARMNQRGREGSLRDFDLTNLAVLVIKQNDIKKFAFLAAEMIAKVSIDIFRGAKRLARFPSLSPHAPAGRYR